VVTPLERVAEWVGALAPDRVPAGQHRLARIRLVDTLGLIAAAAGHEAGTSLRAFADANPGTGATVLTTGQQALPSTAALVHGSLAHARDFDDTYIDSVVHPGSTVIAAALAAGESVDAPLDALSTAIIIGYEVAARLGMVAGRGFHARGFHATGIVGPIAAAAAAGHLMRLDASRLADAMGLATSMSSGLLAFLGDGGWSKWMHTGWSAHGGLIAAQLASTGFRGPRQGFDHRFGLYGAFLGKSDVDLAALGDGLGSVWRGATAQAKLYPCAHVIQPYIDAGLALREKKFAVGNIASIRCVMAPWATPIVGEPRDTKIAPRNDLEAIASLPFMLAAALVEGRVDLATLTPTTIRSTQIRALACRVTCEADASLGMGFDGRMEIVRSDASTLSRAVALTPPSEAQIIAKFRANTAACPQAACDALLGALLSEMPRCRELMRLATAVTVGRHDARARP
jgi:2-methylcitrate dehydratase PrpD